MTTSISRALKQNESEDAPAPLKIEFLSLYVSFSLQFLVFQTEMLHDNS